LGLLGLTPGSLYDLTFREFSNAVRGRYKAQELFDRSHWERVRWQTALLLNVHTKKGASIRTKDLATFPWEVDEGPGISTGFQTLKALAKKKDGDTR